MSCAQTGGEQEGESSDDNSADGSSDESKDEKGADENSEDAEDPESSSSSDSDFDSSEKTAIFKVGETVCVLASQRRGCISEVKSAILSASQPSGLSLAKVQFSDGALPEEDWFALSQLQAEGVASANPEGAAPLAAGSAGAGTAAEEAGDAASANLARGVPPGAGAKTAVKEAHATDAVKSAEAAPLPAEGVGARTAGEQAMASAGTGCAVGRPLQKRRKICIVSSSARGLDKGASTPSAASSSLGHGSRAEPPTAKRAEVVQEAPVRCAMSPFGRPGALAGDPKRKSASPASEPSSERRTKATGKPLKPVSPEGRFQLDVKALQGRWQHSSRHFGMFTVNGTDVMFQSGTQRVKVCPDGQICIGQWVACSRESRRDKIIWRHAKRGDLCAWRYLEEAPLKDDLQRPPLESGHKAPAAAVVRRAARAALPAPAAAARCAPAAVDVSSPKALQRATQPAPLPHSSTGHATSPPDEAEMPVLKRRKKVVADSDSEDDGPVTTPLAEQLTVPIAATPASATFAAMPPTSRDSCIDGTLLNVAASPVQTSVPVQATAATAPVQVLAPTAPGELSPPSPISTSDGGSMSNSADVDEAGAASLASNASSERSDARLSIQVQAASETVARALPATVPDSEGTTVRAPQAAATAPMQEEGQPSRPPVSVAPPPSTVGRDTVKNDLSSASLVKSNQPTQQPSPTLAVTPLQPVASQDAGKRSLSEAAPAKSNQPSQPPSSVVPAASLPPPAGKDIGKTCLSSDSPANSNQSTLPPSSVVPLPLPQAAGQDTGKSLTSAKPTGSNQPGQPPSSVVPAASMPPPASQDIGKRSLSSDSPANSNQSTLPPSSVVPLAPLPPAAGQDIGKSFSAAKHTGSNQPGQPPSSVVPAAPLPATASQEAQKRSVSSATPTSKVARSLEEAQAKLERFPPPDEAAELLKYLGSLPMDVQTLARTKVGISVNRARKEYAADRALAADALELMDRWKRLWKEHVAQASSTE